MFETDRPPELSRNASHHHRGGRQDQKQPHKDEKRGDADDRQQASRQVAAAALTGDSAEALGFGAPATDVRPVGLTRLQTANPFGLLPHRS